MKLPMTALAAVLALGSGVAVVPAFADDDDDKVRARYENLDSRARGFTISRQEAMDIARSPGMVSFEEIELDDEDDDDDDDDDQEWELEGRTADGREMEIEISARSGRVMEVEYDD